MGFNLSGIGNLITNAGGGQFVDVFNQVLDPVMGIANPFLDLGGSFLKSVISLPTAFNNALGQAVSGLSSLISSPTTLYIIAGVVLVGGIYALNSGAASPIKYR